MALAGALRLFQSLRDRANLQPKRAISNATHRLESYAHGIHSGGTLSHSGSSSSAVSHKTPLSH